MKGHRSEFESMKEKKEISKYRMSKIIRMFVRIWYVFYELISFYIHPILISDGCFFKDKAKVTIVFSSELTSYVLYKYKWIKLIKDNTTTISSSVNIVLYILFPLLLVVFTVSLEGIDIKTEIFSDSKNVSKYLYLYLR